MAAEAARAPAAGSAPTQPVPLDGHAAGPAGPTSSFSLPDRHPGGARGGCMPNDALCAGSPAVREGSDPAGPQCGGAAASRALAGGGCTGCVKGRSLLGGAGCASEPGLRKPCSGLPGDAQLHHWGANGEAPLSAPSLSCWAPADKPVPEARLGEAEGGARVAEGVFRGADRSAGSESIVRGSHSCAADPTVGGPQRGKCAIM